MKTARRYLAWALAIALFFAVLPFALLRNACEWVLDLIMPTLDDLEAITRDK